MGILQLGRKNIFTKSGNQNDIKIEKNQEKGPRAIDSNIVWNPINPFVKEEWSLYAVGTFTRSAWYGFSIWQTCVFQLTVPGGNRLFNYKGI